MKNRITTLALALAMVSVGSTAWANHHEGKGDHGKEHHMDMGKPAAELKPLEVFLGKWSCEGKQMMAPGSPMEAVKGEIRMDAGHLDGKWLHGHASFWPTKEATPKMTMDSVEFWGYDVTKKVFVRKIMDNMGGAGDATAPAMAGDKLVWSGEWSGPMGAMKFRHTLTKKSDKEITDMFEGQAPDGKWMNMGESSCKKQ